MPLGLLIPAAVVSTMLGPAQSNSPVVTCRLTAGERVYRLARGVGEDAGWTLSMRRGPGDEEWIHLPLPRAEPQLGDDTLVLRYRNANGGRQIELDVTPSGSRLDVWVDYGLDVNIEPDLDPDVDEMNTHGPIDALDCTIAAR